MPPFLLSAVLPAPALTLAPLPPPPPPPAPPRAARHHPAPLTATSKPTLRRPYRRRPAPAPAPPQRPRYAASRPSLRARSEEELEAAVYDFMRRSDKPGAFPTRAELLAAGRGDLAAAVESSGGWLSLGWSSGRDAGVAVTAPASSADCVHPDYPPEAGPSDLAPAAGASGREAGASPSGRQPETEETAEGGFGTGLGGMLTRLQRERERARALPQSSNQAEGQGDNRALMSHNGSPSHAATGGKYTLRIPENENIHSSRSQNGTLEDNKALRSSTNDAWRTWTLDKAAEVHPSDNKENFKHDDLDTVFVQDVVHRPSNGVAVNDYPSDCVNTERDEIHSRLQNLELDLTAALKTIRSRFDNVLSDMSNVDKANVLNRLSDDLEFEETKVMQAQEELQSIRAKMAVLKGKMALEIIERNKIIEERQRRLDEVEKALSELRTVYIEWPNPASEVLLAGSFDGWTKQRRMERSENGVFSLNLRLYPGRYEIKFIVDGIWMTDPLRPTLNNHGHENNLLVVT